jgi:hypothetical protein
MPHIESNALSGLGLGDIDNEALRTALTALAHTDLAYALVVWVDGRCLTLANISPDDFGDALETIAMAIEAGDAAVSHVRLDPTN